MIIPFAQPLGPTNGPASDGVIYGSLTYAKPTAVITESAAIPISRVIRGNADAAGSVSYEDVTSQLASVDAVGVTLFDTVNPTADQLWLEIGETDATTGFGIHVTTAGVYTGTVACQTKYKSTSGSWVTVNCTISGQLDTTGIKYITFPEIAGSSLAVHDDLIDPVNGTPSRKYQVIFTGITGVTTAPVVDRIIRTTPASGAVKTNLAGYSVDNVADIPVSYQSLEIMSHIGDRTLFAFDAPFAKLKTTIQLERTTADAKLIYSRADGSYGDLSVIALESASVARPGQFATVDPGASPVTYTDTINPPSDWAATTLTINGVGYTGYWVGIEYTAADTAPVPAMLVAMQAGMISGTSGITADSTASGTTVTTHARGVSDTDTIMMLANLTSGARATFTIPAGSSMTSSTGVAVASGNKFLLQQLSGSETSVLSDGFFNI